MKKIVVLACAAVLCAAAFVLAFAAGRSAAIREYAAKTPAPTQGEIASGAVEAPPLPSALTEVSMQVETPVAATGENYVLILEEDALVVKQGEETVAVIGDVLPLPGEAEEELRQGLAFETLSEIESYLEAYES